LPRERSRDAPRSEIEDLLAPPWHTTALIVLMVAVAATGTWLSRQGGPAAAPATGSPLVTLYLPMIVVQWGLTLYVCRIGRPRNALRQLIGRGWNRHLGPVMLDVALAALVWLLIGASEMAVGRHGGARSAAALAMLPHTPLERAAWVLVAGSAGFCEEVVYRGYLQTQLTGFTGRASFGIVLQSILFGIAHGEQGPAPAMRFAVYGCVFGVLARWRRSLLPGMACHIGIDLASGLLAPR
jgi:membrane protease YdiL (CAAX protease family)